MHIESFIKLLINSDQSNMLVLLMNLLLSSVSYKLSIDTNDNLYSQIIKDIIMSSQLAEKI